MSRGERITGQEVFDGMHDLFSRHLVYEDPVTAPVSVMRRADLLIRQIREQGFTDGHLLGILSAVALHKVHGDIHYFDDIPGEYGSD